MNDREYSGIVTRTIAFAIDAAIINVVALLVAAGVSLCLSVLPGSQRLHTLQIIIAGAAWLIWYVAYWATFWSTTGQTPGDRVMRIQVTRPDGSRLRAMRAIGRVGTTVLAALPLLAGFIPILLNDQRRGLHDKLSDTVVTRMPAEVTVVATGTFEPATPRPAGS